MVDFRIVGYFHMGSNWARPNYKKPQYRQEFDKERRSYMYNLGIIIHIKVAKLFELSVQIIYSCIFLSNVRKNAHK